MMSLDEFEQIERQLEAPVRALRDKVYGQQSTDHNWNGCKSGYQVGRRFGWLTMESNDWLKKHAEITLN